MKNLFFLLLLLFALTLLPACSTQHATTPPKVNLVDLNVDDVSLFQTTLKIKTTIKNLDNFPVTFSGATHALSLNGVDLGEAVSQDSFRLAARDSKEVEATIELSHLTLASKIQELLSAKSLSYILKSEFYSGSNFLNRKTITSEAKGTLLR